MQNFNFGDQVKVKKPIKYSNEITITPSMVGEINNAFNDDITDALKDPRRALRIAYTLAPPEYEARETIQVHIPLMNLTHA